jgi:hypothetical protein
LLIKTHYKNKTDTISDTVPNQSIVQPNIELNVFKTHERHHKMPYCERWEDMVAEVDLLFQWAIANRLNKIEWLLLGIFKCYYI